MVCAIITDNFQSQVYAVVHKCLTLQLQLTTYRGGVELDRL